VKRQLPTHDIERCIAAAIRAGAFPQVAAESYGIPARDFDNWMRHGNDPALRSLRHEVMAARAQARLRAEIAVLDSDPHFWLTHGPGREQGRTPGWTVAVKPSLDSAARPNLLLDRQVVATIQDILRALETLPGAQQTIDEQLPAKFPRRFRVWRG
jgi:hypothetical protein